MMTTLSSRYDFARFFAVQDGNPNGSPDPGNRPCMDLETGAGWVTDICRDLLPPLTGFWRQKPGLLVRGTLIHTSIHELSPRAPGLWILIRQKGVFSLLPEC